MMKYLQVTMLSFMLLMSCKSTMYYIDRDVVIDKVNNEPIGEVNFVDDNIKISWNYNSKGYSFFSSKSI
jgi:hypothetical protein